MNKTLKAKWVAALRSGKYEQGRSSLSGHGQYCCLGVLCRVSGMTDGQIRKLSVEEAGYGLIKNWLLPKEKLKEFGLPDVRQRKLAGMNDDGRSFAAIATAIEKAKSY